MQSLPDFLLLDMDDTILDYSAPGERSWQILCNSSAPKLDGISPEQLLAAIKASGKWFWSDAERYRKWSLDLRKARRLVVARAFEHLQIDNPTLSAEIADAFTSLREELIQPFPGAVETLLKLHDRGIHMGLITNGNAEFQRAKIRRFELEPYFDFILIESEFGVGKPDKRIFRHALQRFGISPALAWMIGDNLEFDIRPAQELGMNTVWVNYAKMALPGDHPIQPTRMIYSLAELLD